MKAEVLSLDTAAKLARCDKAVEVIKENIDGINEYDINRTIYSGGAVIDMLNELLEILEVHK